MCVSVSCVFETKRLNLINLQQCLSLTVLFTAQGGSLQARAAEGLDARGHSTGVASAALVWRGRWFE